MSITEIVFLFTGVLAIYTIGLVLSRKYQYVNAVVCVSSGLVLDYWGTWQMYNLSDNFSWGLHAVIGATAIIFITASVLVGLVGLFIQSHKLSMAFHHSLPWTYGVWVISYLNGFFSYGA